jgi:hypothetical protein
MTFNVKDIAAGLTFVALGGWFAAGSLGLELGTPLRMGPGFFPLILAGLLVAIGAVIVLQGLQHAPSALGSAPWRGIVMLSAAPIVFGATIRGLGLVLAVALAAGISAFASRRMSLLLAAAVTAGLTLFCILVFHYGLGLPIRLFGPWLTN